MSLTVPATSSHSQHSSSILGRVAVLSLTLLLGACASQMPSQTPTKTVPTASTAERSALRKMVAQQDRLYRVAAPLMIQNAELCASHARNLLGFTAKNQYSYTSALIEEARSVLGLDERLQVMGILQGSGADKAGLRRGDKLITVEGQPMPTGPGAERQAATLLVPLVAPQGGRDGLQLTVLRGGANMALSIPFTRGCGYSIEVGNADLVNAYADGRRILITRGMMDFTQSDTELAYVLAKTIAHNVFQHASELNMHATLEGVIENLSQVQPDEQTLAGSNGIKPMPAELDAQADRLGLYLAARAGYSVDGAVSFWQRLERQYPTSVRNGYSALHPQFHARLPVLRNTVIEILGRLASNAPLQP